VKLKTLYSERKTHTFTVDITEKLKILSNLLAQAENSELWKVNNQFRLISSNVQFYNLGSYTRTKPTPFISQRKHKGRRNININKSSKIIFQ
jgi:hypothetical protein